MKSVWRNAAELVGGDRGACQILQQLDTGISGGCVSSPSLHTAQFKTVFFEGQPRYGYWWGWDEEGQTGRAIALLLMELLEQDGALP